MADKETNATAGKEKRKERWLFTDEMVEELLEVLRDTKSNMAGKGLDFEGDLVKLYADVRTMMAEKFEESDFGPKEIMQPSVEIDEMSRDEYREFKEKVDEQERAIKLGYDRIKAKVKKLRSGFQKCVAESTRSGSGRIIKEHWDALVAIWGGTPGAEPLECGINTMAETSSESGKPSGKVDTKESEDLSTETKDDEEAGPPERKKQKCATARYVDDKRKKLEKKLSTRQKECMMLETMRGDMELKKKILAQDTSNTSSADQALSKIADSMQILSQAILTGFQQLNSLQGSNYQFNAPRHPQQDHVHPFGGAYHNNPSQYSVLQPFSGRQNPFNTVASASPSASSSASWEESSVEDHDPSLYPKWM